MTKEYSIAEARQDFAAIVKELDHQPVIQITRRGKNVAVLLSIQEYDMLRTEKTGFWQAFTAFRKTANLAESGIEPDIFDNIRNRESGRPVDL